MSRMPEGFQEPWEDIGHFVLFPLLASKYTTKKGHNTCTLKLVWTLTSAFHRVTFGVCSWCPGKSLPSFYYKRVLWQMSHAQLQEETAWCSLWKWRAFQNFMPFCAVLEVLRGHEGTWIAWVWRFPEIVIISQWSTRGFVAMWSKTEKTKSFIAIAFIEILISCRGC